MRLHNGVEFENPEKRARPLHIIHPEGLFHSVWDVLMAAILLLTFLMMPLNFFDQFSDSLSVFNICVDVFFLTDCVLNFFTGYINEDNTVVLEHRAIVTTYLRGHGPPVYRNAQGRM